MINNKNIFLKALIIFSFIAGPAQAEDRGVVVDQLLDAFEDESVVTATPLEAGNGNVLKNEKGSRIEVPVKVKETLPGVDFKGTPLKSAFHEISQQTGLTIVAPEQAQGAVTLSLENVYTADLLSLLAHIYGFALDRQGDVVLLMSLPDYQTRMGKEFQKGQSAALLKVEHADLQSMESLVKALKTETGKIFIDLKNRQLAVLDTLAAVNAIKSLVKERDVALTSKTIQLKNIRIADVKAGVESRLYSGLGKAEFNEDQQTITITDQPDVVSGIVEFIQSQDQKREVILEGKVIRISLNEEHANGVDWEAIVSDYQRVDFNGVENESQNSHQMQFGTLSKEDYDVLLEALDTVGDVEDLMPLEIRSFVGQEQTFIIDTNNPFSTLLSQGKDFQLDSQGFKLNTHLLTQGAPLAKNISMQFLFELFWMGGEVGEDGAMVVQAHSPVKCDIEEDTYFVFGGLLKRQTVSRTRKVPLLGDLPVLGGAFRRDRVRPDNTEYIIFLRPKLEKGPAL
ncbi:MAG TPA: hypothetical protein P5246_01670 [Candidatus Omnitrophota bacterium]|nr:hypothetical protein [Candidatus Omnitrophota bacterium]HSA30602.1 hypothetical protein [Candidatus Omnitrophota bacterium]